MASSHRSANTQAHTFNNAINTIVKLFYNKTMNIDVICSPHMIKDFITTFCERMYSSARDVIVDIAALVDEKLSLQIQDHIRRSPFIIEKNVRKDLDGYARLLGEHILKLIRHGKIGILIISSLKTLNDTECKFIEELVDEIRWDANILVVAPRDSCLHKIVENNAKKYHVDFQRFII